MCWFTGAVNTRRILLRFLPCGRAVSPFTERSSGWRSRLSCSRGGIDSRCSLRATDVVALCGTPGLFFGRIGNFVNGELYGRPTNVPWAMIFPSDPQHVPRHPSPLYEAFAEGVLLSAVLWWIDGAARGRGYSRPGLITGMFLVGYAVIRFSLEFTRAP